MPPKRKTATVAKSPANKRAKTVATAKKGAKEKAAAKAPSTAKELVDALKKSDVKKRTHKVDSLCDELQRGSVVADYDCMLNQTNIGNNNNKFYVIQVIQDRRGYWVWNRWGRVGEPGTNALRGPFKGLKEATDDFEKKFYEKTRNKWDKRGEFKAAAGKYTLLEMGDDDEPDTGSAKSTTAKKVVREKNCEKCTLDQPTQELVKLIFDENMFKDALEELEIDVQKMPLGKMSKSQIAKGFEALEKIEDAIDKKAKKDELDKLSSEFYTVIPHNFGRDRPTTIDNKDLLQRKMDLLTVLADIELAQAMQKEEEESKSKKTTKKEPHPLDAKYNMLHCKLKLLNTSSSTYKIIETYVNATKDSYSYPKKILGVWEVDRELEGKRFSANDKIDYRKLLWHGTSIAVVAAILKTGLRIMPHSGGCVGKGIYFASENGKSSDYVGTTKKKIGIMFLNEVALGKQYEIGLSSGNQRSAPKGYDSIVARGVTEPDPTKDTKLVLDGKTVIVPQGEPIDQPKWSKSQFYQSEYLIYREDQCRIRYLLKLQF